MTSEVITSRNLPATGAPERAVQAVEAYHAERAGGFRELAAREALKTAGEVSSRVPNPAPTGISRPPRRPGR